jgi:hypothetical protein
MVTPEFYEICVKGRLGPEWSAWFDGLSIDSHPSDETVLSGAVRDQAALHGILAKIRDLGLPLLSVHRVPSDSRESLGREESPCGSTYSRFC